MQFGGYQPSGPTWAEVKDQYPSDEDLKSLMKQRSIRVAVQNIAKKHLPNWEAMHADFIEKRTKYQSKPEELKQFERGCSTLASFLKQFNFPDFREARAQAGQPEGQVPEAPPAAKTKHDLRREALDYCQAQAIQEKEKNQYRQARYTPKQFSTMNMTSIKFNEQGKRILREQDDQQEEEEKKEPGYGRGDDDDRAQNPEEMFFAQNETRDFEAVIREQVYNCLLYRGDLQLMMTTDYFVGDQFKDKYHYCASAKVPFYMIYHCSPLIQDELAAKYLDNPLNPIMFMQYDQNHQQFQELDEPAPEIERQFNISHLYNKLKSETPMNNLLCIGSPGAGKSDRLNSMFAVEFEKLDPRACGLWHDSVDVIFSSNDVPLKFNVFDFHGKMANNDFRMIAELFDVLPNTYLLVQVIDVSYLEKLEAGVIKAHGEDAFAKMKQRMIIVSNTQSEAKKEAIKEKSLSYGIVGTAAQAQEPEKRQGFYHFGDLGAANSEQAKAMGEEIFKKLQQNTEELKDTYEQELRERKEAMMFATGNNAQEYDFIHGLYWYLEDSLTQLQKASSQQGGPTYNVRCKDQKFREKHRQVKQYLLNLREDLLNREEVFVFYMSTLRQVKITNQLRTDYELDERGINALKEEKQKLSRDSSNLDPHPLFMMYFDMLKSQDSDSQNDQDGSSQFKSDQIYDMLNLVEAYYKPKIKNIDEGERQKYVLDSELFAREARYFTRSERGRAHKDQYAQAMSSLLEEGKAIEIIDGDIDKLEKDSLRDIMQWVERRRRGNSKLVVITILGPQSSGKSTLLNFLTGAKFHVSAGRCTKGLNAMLLRTEFQTSQEILILDSEGLFSIERNDPKYDRRLAIFCFSVSNFLLINIKGELNTQVKEVLQVSVYALKKIREMSNVNISARPHFICRDINTGTKKDIQIQFDKIKLSLEEAAQAAEENLHDLLDIDRASDMMDTFHGAIDKKAVYANEVLTQTKYHPGFRDQCGQLRRRLIDFSKTLENQQRVFSLKQLVEEMSIVWTAVTENNNLVLVKNLRHINDHRNLENAMTTFKRIMAKVDEGDNDKFKDSGEENPLLKAQGSMSRQLKDYKKIMPAQRLYAILDNLIQTALKQQDQMENDEGLERLENQTREAMQKEVNKWWCTSGSGGSGLAFEMAKFFTEDMSPDLQHIAKFFAKTYILAIHKKAKRSFAKQFTEIKIKKKIQFVSKGIRQQLQQNSAAAEEIKEMLQEKFDELRNELENDLPKDHDRQEECDNKLKQFCQFVNVNQKDFISVQTDPAPINPAFDGDRKKLAEIDYVRVLVTDDAELAEQNFNSEEARHKIIQPDIDPLFECIDNWARCGNNQTREQKKNDLKTLKKEQMENWVKEMFQTFKKQIRDLIQQDEQVNAETNAIKRFKKDQLGRYHAVFSKLQEKRFKDKYDRDMDLEVIGNQEYDKAWDPDNPDATGLYYHRKCYKLDFERNQFFTICEALILHRLDTQAVRNLNVQKADINRKLEEEKKEINKRVKNTQEEVKGEQGIAKSLVRCLTERVQKELRAIYLEKWRKKKENLPDNFKKKTDPNNREVKGNMEQTLERFINATGNDVDFIVAHMTKPVEAEEMVFNNKWEEKLTEIVNNLNEEFAADLNRVIKHLQGIFQVFKQKFANVPEHSEKTRAAYGDLIYYLYYLLFFDQWKNAGENQEETEVQNLKTRKSELEKAGVFLNGQAVVEMPALDPSDPNQQVFKGEKGALAAGLDQNQWESDQEELKKVIDLLYADQINLGQFFQNFDDIERMIESDKSEWNKEMDEKLQEEKKSVDSKDDIKKAVLGCLGECPFCGARCEADIQCRPDQQEHNTRYHRPMAFKGTFENDKALVDKRDANGNVVIGADGQPEKEEQKVQVLLDDHCLSENNLKHSIWRETIDEEKFSFLERLNKSVETNGINIILEWESGADLDIHTKCGCGKWTDTPYNIKCKKCDMARDIDTRSGKNRRKAVEHIYYAKPDALLNKELGCYVQNYLPQGGGKEVKFTVSVLNKYGKTIWPEPGQGPAHQEWMKCGNTNQAESERKTFVYTEAMHKAGIVDFKTHLEQKQANSNDAKWDISEDRAKDAEQDEEAQRYRKSWNDKWQIVKQRVCEIHKCQLLDKISTDGI